MDKYIWNLQLFADGGGAAGGDGGAAAGAGDATGAIAPDAGVRKGRRRENPLANVRYGKQSAAAQEPAVQEQAANTQDVGEEQTRPSFEDLIKGEYKDEFGARVQQIIQQRFKGNQENEDKLGKIQPILEMLGQKYNVDPANIDEIAKIVGDDDSLYEDEAMERGVSVESLKAIKQLERDNERLRAREERSMQEMRMRQHFDNLAQQADQAKALYPNLDLGVEMQNPTFARLTAPGVGIDVRTAYEVVHRDEMRGAEMQFAAQKSAERMANAIRSGSMRPSENGLNSQQGGSTVKTDPTSLTKSDRAEIKRRVRNGEKIVF